MTFFCISQYFSYISMYTFASSSYQFANGSCSTHSTNCSLCFETSCIFRVSRPTQITADTHHLDILSTNNYHIHPPLKLPLLPKVQHSLPLPQTTPHLTPIPRSAPPTQCPQHTSLRSTLFLQKHPQAPHKDATRSCRSRLACSQRLAAGVARARDMTRSSVYD